MIHHYKATIYISFLQKKDLGSESEDLISKRLNAETNTGAIRSSMYVCTEEILA